MNRLIILIISIFFLNNCSLNKNLGSWKDKEKNIENKKNIKKVFENSKPITSEFNPQLKLDLSEITIENKIFDNKNNFGSQNYDGLLNKVKNFKFSKFKKIEQLNYKPIFLDDGLIFFEKKGSIKRYSNDNKVLWEKNYYSKSEKKLEPKLYFSLNNKNLLVVDNISKYYSINIDTGELNWVKNNIYPFNSEIKIDDNKFFVVDYKNILRCYFIKDGSECWELQTEDSFTISNSKFSLVINKNVIIFSNSIGDITAVDIETGQMIWQIPTQKSSIINETYSFKISKLVSDGKSIFFSNNKNEFYSVNSNTGIINWINDISSNITPILSGNLIFTISNEGYLYVINKKEGNIIRVNYLFKNYKEKIRKDIKSTGFIIGKTNLYLTNSNGDIIKVDLSSGNILKTEKVSSKLISEPFVFNQNLFLISNGSIIQYD